ncbi:hypothetical protein [Inhella sp.]|uniref:hypothetical protein n=1 Tax=Inhella sp. TaxID=1921806 RepID=UPI0035B1F647
MTPTSLLDNGLVKRPEVDIRFGFTSIKDRYSKSKRGLERFIDPFSRSILQFRDPLVYDNWLLRRFDSSIRFVDAHQATWSALCHGELVEVKPHLHWISTTGRGHLELVVSRGRAAGPKAARALIAVCTAHQLQPVLRTEAVIRSSLEHLQRLDLVRHELALNTQLTQEVHPLYAVQQLIMNERSVMVVDVVRVLATVGWSLSDMMVTALLLYWRQIGQVWLIDDAGRISENTSVHLGWAFGKGDGVGSISRV